MHEAALTTDDEQPELLESSTANRALLPREDVRSSRHSHRTCAILAVISLVAVATGLFAGTDSARALLRGPPQDELLHEGLANKVDVTPSGKVETSATGPVAVLIVGTVKRLVLAPVLGNIIHANAKLGVPVHLYVSLHFPKGASGKQFFSSNKRESTIFVKEEIDIYSVDPRVNFALKKGRNAEGFFRILCDWAVAAGAKECHTLVEEKEPVALVNDAKHQQMITAYSPLNTTAGKILLIKWRSLGYLWKKAEERMKSGKFTYKQVLVVRDDDYWLEPYPLNRDFGNMDKQVRTMPCIQSHGFNDKVLHLGKHAAEVLMGAYQVWVRGDPYEKDSLTAEAFLMKLAKAHGLTLIETPMPVAPSVYTNVGVPCFRKQTFDLSPPERGGSYSHCYGEPDDTAHITSLFHNFNCRDVGATFLDEISPQEADRLHDAITRAAGIERKPILLVIIPRSASVTIERMLGKAGNGAESDVAVVVVGTNSGVCDNFVVAGHQRSHACTEIPMGSRPRMGGGQVRDVLFRHAIVTSAALSGLTKGVITADPGLVFSDWPTVAGSNSDADAVFMLPRTGSGCSTSAPTASLPTQLKVDAGLFFLNDTVGAAHLLLTAWNNLVKEEAGRQTFVYGWALTSAAQEAAGVRVANVNCGFKKPLL